MPRPAVEEARAAFAAEAGQRVDTHWVTRAILPSLVGAVPPPPQHSCCWHLELADMAALSSAVVYTDGSMIDAAPRLAGLCARLGWALAVVDQHGTLLAAASGRPSQLGSLGAWGGSVGPATGRHGVWRCALIPRRLLGPAPDL